MSTPIDTDNIAMDGSWIRTVIDPSWHSVIIKMRETNVILNVRGYGETSTYFTIAVGSQIILNTEEFTNDEFIEFKAASGTLEILGFLRK